MENEQYLWAVARYIERNPMKVRLSERAEDYRRASAKPHLTGGEDSVMGALSTWLDPSERTAYAEFEFLLAEDVEMDEEIRKATSTGRPFGTEGFINMLEFRLKRVLKSKRVGRPPKETGECP
ncbi:MAG: hypothetical protein R6W72_02890 [Desulfurivibrionaceae bacterium]